VQVIGMAFYPNKFYFVLLVQVIKPNPEVFIFFSFGKVGSQPFIQPTLI
jgi:hypothetical protein